MSLTNAWVQPHGKLPALFEKIRDGQAPERVTQQLLKDWGFTASMDRAFIPLLKALGFLTEDGKPTQMYNDYRDHSRSKKVLGRALKTAYGDIFLIKARPTKEDRVAIEGKFKSFHNASGNTAGLMAKTVLSLLELADISDSAALRTEPVKTVPEPHVSETKPDPITNANGIPLSNTLGFRYNIEIHLPPTKDVEVYNAIFKSLREHLLDQ